MDTHRWRELLTELSHVTLASNNTDAHTRAAAVDGWLGFAPVDEAAIAAAEARLGVRLPPSYCAFLAVSDGWRDCGPFISRLFSSAEMDWFAVRHQDWIDIWLDDDDEIPVSDEEYGRYGEEQDSGAIRVEYLPTMLQVSDVGDAAVILLNPRVIFPDGEWEAWFFANWIPGAYRYRSFWELVVDQLESARDRLREERGEPNPWVHPSLGVAADDVDGLLAALNRPAWEDQFHAIEALGNLRAPRAVEPLLAILRDRGADLALRERAAVALGRTRDPRVLPALIDALGAEAISADIFTVGALLGNPASLPCDPDEVAAVSAMSLPEFLSQLPAALAGVAPPELLAQIVAGLSPEGVAGGIGDHLAHAVRQGLLEYGPGALPALEAALERPDPELRRRVQAVISDLGGSAT